MKSVVILLLTCIISIHVSAQKSQEADTPVKNSIESVVIEQATKPAVAIKSTEKTGEKASRANSKKEANKKVTTLKHEKAHAAKSRFETMLKRRMEIDAEEQ